jgi:hypothetical protein
MLVSARRDSFYTGAIFATNGYGALRISFQSYVDIVLWNRSSAPRAHRPASATTFAQARSKRSSVPERFVTRTFVTPKS